MREVPVAQNSRTHRTQCRNGRGSWQHGCVTLPNPTELTSLADAALRACGASGFASGGQHDARSPITGTTLGSVAATQPVDQVVDQAGIAFQAWRTTPGPLRGELIRQ